MTETIPDIPLPDEPSPHIRPPTEASPGRRALHTVIALAGWALFFYWWTVVFAHVSFSEVRFTVFFVLVSLVASIVITGLWILHNVAIFKRKGPRTGVREVALDYSHDPLGRPVTFESSPGALRTAPAVRVRIDANGKSFRAAVRPNGGPTVR